MRHSAALGLLAALVAGAACDRSPSPSDPSRARIIRLEIPAEPDVSDIPRLMAKDVLEQAGYIVDPTAYRDNIIAIQALVNGELDLAVVSLPGTLAAIQQGANVVIIMEAANHTRALVTAPEITQCADLQGKQVAVPNLVSAQTLAFRRYIATRCPGTDVEVVVISGADNRLASLLTYRTGGAILDLMSLTEIQRPDKPRFNLLSAFGTDFPGLGGAAVVASRSFLERSPDAARDVVRAWVEAVRTVQDRAVLALEIEARFGLAPDRAAAAATTYLTAKAWDLNGGLADGFMQRNIEFASDMGAIKPGLTPDATADTRYLAAALAEVGRK